MITEEKKKALEHFAEGRKLYKLMKFAQAREGAHHCHLAAGRQVIVFRKEGACCLAFLR